MPRSSTQQAGDRLGRAARCTNRLRARVSASTCHSPPGSPPPGESFASLRNSTAPAAAARLRRMRTYRELFGVPEFTAPLRRLVAPGGGVDGQRAWRWRRWCTRHRVTAAGRAEHVRRARFAQVARRGRCCCPRPTGCRPGPPHTCLAADRRARAAAVRRCPGCRVRGDPRDLSRASASSASLGGGVRYGLLTEILPPGGVHPRPFGAEHVGRRHADRRLRGRRCPRRPHCPRAARCSPPPRST